MRPEDIPKFDEPPSLWGPLALVLFAAILLGSGWWWYAVFAECRAAGFSVMYCL